MLTISVATLTCLFATSPIDGRALEGRIAFYSSRDGNYEIYSVKPDGSGLKRLTDHPADDQCPSWSFDGTQLAFISQRSGGGDIYIMDADGENLRRLTTSDAS